jgi:EpsI family protein
MDGELDVTYESASTRVGIYLPYYRIQRQGKELVNSRNVLVSQKDKVWHQKEVGTRDVSLPGHSDLRVNEAVLSSNQQELLVWQFYWVGDRYTASRYWAKLYEVEKLLFGKTGLSGAIMVYGEYEPKYVGIGDELGRFLVEVLPTLQEQLASSATVASRMKP